MRERQLASGQGADDDFLAEVEGRRAEAREHREDRGPRGDDRRRRRKRGFLEDLLDFD